jgi:hypothetical protein
MEQDRRSGGEQPGEEAGTRPEDALNEAVDDPEADAAVMGLLSDHVPLSLLMDLTAPAGPDSEAILEQEGEPDDAWWEQS